MLPLKDDNPTSRFPIITITLISINVMIYFYSDILGYGGREFLFRFSVIPRNVISLGRSTGVGPGSAVLGLFTSQFLHGGFIHLAGNMLFLWIFGNNVEDRLGRIKFVLFYMACGVAAAFAQIMIDPQSDMPMIGASGAVAGVMAAYVLAFPRARVLTLIWVLYFIRLVRLPAFVIILYWIALQVFFQIGAGSAQGGVAYMAHIGGFAAGLVLFRLLLLLARKKNNL